MTTFHYWFYIDQYVEGLGFLHSDFFSDSAKDELEHAKRVAFRLDQLGSKATGNPKEWAEISGLGDLEPDKHLTLRSALEGAQALRELQLLITTSLQTIPKERIT